MFYRFRITKNLVIHSSKMKSALIKVLVYFNRHLIHLNCQVTILQIIFTQVTNLIFSEPFLDWQLLQIKTDESTALFFNFSSQCFISYSFRVVIFWIQRCYFCSFFIVIYRSFKLIFREISVATIKIYSWISSLV